MMYSCVKGVDKMLKKSAAHRNGPFHLIIFAVTFRSNMLRIVEHFKGLGRDGSKDFEDCHSGIMIVFHSLLRKHRGKWVRTSVCAVHFYLN